MAQKTDNQLLTEAGVIKNETSAGANTASRVGTMIEDIVDSKVNKDSILSTDGSTYTELLKDRLTYYYSGNQKTIDLIFPVDPNDNLQIEIPNPSQNGILAMVENTFVYDLSNGNYTMASDGIYQFSNCDGGTIEFPDATLFNGKKITIINVDGTNSISISGNNPYWLGSDTTISTLGMYTMFIFVSINGVWRGGYLLD